MTLEEAIQHHQKVATTFGDKDSEQLAAWLTELQEYRAKTQAKLITNGDKIRQTADEELVMALDTDCNRCARSENCELCGDPVSYGDCVKGNIEWLEQEVGAE